MAQRISRAKQTIKKAGARFDEPSERERAERLDAVLHVLYLIFNEGYSSSAGRPCSASISRAKRSDSLRALYRLLPANAEVEGLLALMLLTDARREARSGPGGELVPLDEQDRSRWDRSAIEEGSTLVSRALCPRRGRSLPAPSGDRRGP